ncbi:hypothetical protein HPB48_027018 [Haemaphysalis longicornis]|uniref:Uncharacterized protein n=1 Tax=Haemaphysalis longicornis TaxID=44386 RepID=A0A9J6HAW8_HAELO|nr:hypothetical protein HPB48_027018 [Haemaphysalis longicornis]
MRPQDRKLDSADIPVTVDSHSVMALVDIGIDFSVIRCELGTKLKKGTTLWYLQQIRTAGSHLVTPIGACTERIQIRGVHFPGSFHVLRQCSKQLTLRLDFLHEYGTIIDLREFLVTIGNR